MRNTADLSVSSKSPGFKIRGAFPLIDSPKDTYIWEANTSHTISWTTTGSIGQVDILYSTDNFSSAITPIASSYANTGSCSWGVPNLVSNNVKIRIRDTNDPTLVYKDMTDPFDIVARIQVTKPLLNDIYRTGELYQVKWRTWGPVPNIQIQVSTDLAHSTWETIDPAMMPITNNSSADGSIEGVYNWTIPMNKMSENVLIRVQDSRYPLLAYGESGQFKIKGSIKVLAPVLNDEYIVFKSGTYETKYNITWVVSGTGVGDVKLQYFMPGEYPASPTNITTLTPLQGANTYQWEVPDRIASGVRVRVIQANDSLTLDDSQTFYIKGKFWMTELPKTIYTVGEGITVQWQWTGGIANVKIEYSKDGFDTPVEIRPSEVNNGSYSWQAPNDITTAEIVKLRVSSAADPNTNDTTDIPFKIRGSFSAVWPTVANTTVYVGEAKTITWTTNGTMDVVKLEYSTDDGSTWVIPPIADNLSNLGSYLWSVPDAITTTAKLRVIYKSDSSVYGVSANNFKIMGRIEVTRPTTTDHVGEFGWKVNSPEEIRWSLWGTIPNVIMELEGDQPISNSFVCAGTGVGPRNYTYNWNVWNKISTPNASWKIKISDARYASEVTDNSDNGFEVRGDLGITSPVGNEAWIVYDPIKHNVTYPITWTTTGTVDWVRLVYSKDNFATSKSMAGVVGESTRIANTTGGYQ